MYYDALTTAAIASELRDLLSSGRVQAVVHVDDLTLGLEVYAGRQRRYLVVSADARHARVHLTSVKPRRGVDAQIPLLLLLRKYVRGGRVVDVRQPPFERILHLDVAGEEGTFTLIAETMGRHSNVILCASDGQVMDSIKRVGPRLSRVRPMLPGTMYTPPPPQDKLEPADVTLGHLSDMAAVARVGQPLWRVLVNGIRGISPLLAREIVYRAYGEAEHTAGDVEHFAPLLDAYHTLMRHAWDDRWQPCVALVDGCVVAYAPYLLTQYADVQEVETASEAIDRFGREVGGVDAYGPAKAKVHAALQEAHLRVESRVRSLEEQLIPQEELDRLRLCGEMILAYAHAVHPGQRTLEAQVNLEGPPLLIDLAPDASAVENAQDYFRRYEKAKAATADIPGRLESARLELAYLDQLTTDLDLASNWPEIDEVRSALVAGGYTPAKRGPKMQRGKPLRTVSEDGLPILVGRSARQNHEVTFRRASADDLWLHAVDVPGSHVVVQAGGQDIPERTLRRAAQLAAYYSAAGAEGGVLVAYTQRRYVRHIRGAGPGMVTYRNEQTIRVVPHP